VTAAVTFEHLYVNTFFYFAVNNTKSVVYCKTTTLLSTQCRPTNTNAVVKKEIIIN